MILLVGLNPCGLPIICSLRGGDVANFSHGCEFHAFCFVLGFSSLHVVGNANIDQFVTLVALILVCVSFLRHNTNICLLPSAIAYLIRDYYI